MFKSYSSIIPINEIEDSCSLIIERELELFFEFAKKAAYSYSLTVSKNLRNADIDSFKELVLSESDIEKTVNNILFHINNEIKKHISYSDIDISLEDLNKYDENIGILENTFMEYKDLQILNNISEYILNSVINEAVKKLSPGFYVDLIIKKANLTEFLLGFNSSKRQTRLYAEQIYAQIQGILINIKTDIRNEISEAIEFGLSELTDNTKIA